METSQTDIEKACTAFQERVHIIIKLYTKHTTNDDQRELSLATWEAQRCVRHANHVLCTLASKLRSLEHALKAFRDVSANEYITAFSSSLNNNNGSKQSQERILHQWFANYLRLRDGFVLFESGERRHKQDVDTTTSSSWRDFSSRLQSKPKHNDGYTMTFSSKMGYTGYGSDEFNDEQVGIRRRLLDQMIIIKGGCNNNSTEREKIWDKIFADDDDLGILELWNMYIDQVNAVSGSLRNDLTKIQSKFVSDINQHIQTHWRQQSNTIIGKLKLVSEDKAERISFGSFDLCREGDTFTLGDKGGSLPIGMSVMDWKKKFSLPKQQQQPRSSSQQQGNKKRRRILEESSSDEERDDDDMPSKKESTSSSTNTAVVSNGLVIRERREISTSSGAEASKQTSSLDEIKRQAGVSATQLEQGFDQLEGEEFKSTMAANADDLKEGFLADFGNTHSTASSSSSPSYGKRNCPHLISAVEQLVLLRSNNEYRNEYFSNYDVENLWAEFFTVAERWKEAVETLMKIRKDISTGTLKKSSDEAYAARENFREVMMFLGLQCLGIHDFLSEKVVSSLASTSNSASTRNGNSTSLSPFNALLSQTDHCFLLAAEEAFKTALILVMEQEDCQKTLPDSILNRFAKGQHFLLRGRAQHNIGQALELQSQCKFLDHGGGNRNNQKQRLLKQSAKEFADSLTSANLCRGNTTAIYGHVDAGLIDSDSDCTWTSSGMRQSFDSLQLVSLASLSYGICLWKLGELEEAENMFCSRTADLSDYLHFLGDEHISSNEVVDALCDLYWCVMRLTDFGTRFLEDMLIIGGNEKKGGDILRMIKLALQQARLVSDKIFDLVREHSIEIVNNVILTREEIDVEEKSICDMWEKKKALPLKNASNLQSSLQNAATTAFPRSDIGGLVHSTMLSNAPRERFIRDGTSSFSRRSRANKKGKRNERHAASECFNDAFGVEENDSNFDGDGSATSGLDATQPSSQHHGTRLKWGDELLEEHERNAYPACCPPLPPNIPLHLKLAITAKLGDILPCDDKLLAKLYT